MENIAEKNVRKFMIRFIKNNYKQVAKQKFWRLGEL